MAFQSISNIGLDYYLLFCILPIFCFIGLTLQFRFRSRFSKESNSKIYQPMDEFLQLNHQIIHKSQKINSQTTQQHLSNNFKPKPKTKLKNISKRNDLLLRLIKKDMFDFKCQYLSGCQLGLAKMIYENSLAGMEENQIQSLRCKKQIKKRKNNHQFGNSFQPTKLVPILEDVVYFC